MPAALVTGLLIWLVALAFLPAPLAARVLLLAPLAVVPRLIALMPERRWIGRLAGWPALAAALPLLIAFGSPPGLVSAFFVLPWLAIALVAASAGIVHGLAAFPSIVRADRLADLGIDSALGFWAVAVFFSLVDRLGLNLGFSPVIVLLTATHFHFAGLGLLGVASLLARSRPWLRVPVLGLTVGIPLTALGFVLASNPINAIGAVLVGVSGIGVGVGLLTDPASGMWRWTLRIAGAALLISMPLAIAWSLAILSGRSFLDIDAMIRTHGELNALAIVLAVASFRPART